MISAGNIQGADVSIYWTAPGDNGSEGTADGYELRYRPGTIGADTLAWWAGATTVPGLSNPAPPGSNETITVAGLTAGSTVTFLLLTSDEEGNESPCSNALVLTVPDDAGEDPITIDQVAVDPVLEDSARVAWRTDRNTVGFVRYGPDVSYGSQTIAGVDSSTLHESWLTGLEGGGIVHYQIVAIAGARRDSTPDATFLTANAPPSRLSGAEVVTGEDFATLLWQAGGEEDLAGYRVHWHARGREDSSYLHREDFDEAPPGSDPEGWIEESQGGGGVGAFSIDPIPGRGNTLIGAPSGEWVQVRVDTASVPDWSDMEWTGVFRYAGETGIEFLLRALSGGAGYRFGFDPSGALRFAGAAGPLDERVTSPFVPEEGKWYRFRAGAWSRPEGVVLRGTVWEDGTVEPDYPMVYAVDESASPLSPGSIAFRASGSGSAWIDDIVARALPSSASAVDRGLLPFWSHAGLDTDSSYHYWVEAFDQGGMAGLPAGPLIALPFVPPSADTIPPAPISDLTGSADGPFGSVTLQWTAVGDDSLEGRAHAYRVRWSLDPIDESNWEEGVLLTTAAPLPPGSAEERSFSNLTPGETCWIAVRTEDEAGNRSGLSNPLSVTLPPDTIDPVIDNIQVLNILPLSARISWQTDENSDSRVRYGLTDVYEMGSAGDGSMTTAHGLTVEGLQPGTSYHFQVRSTDPYGNEAVSSDSTFTTAVEAPATDPVITGLSLAALSDTDAVVQFDTDIPSIGFVDFGSDSSYGNNVSGGSYQTAHSLRLAPLAPGATYHFRVSAVGEEGGVSTSADLTLTTSMDDEAPLLSSLDVIEVGTDRFTVHWSTDEGATGRIEYGLTDAYGSWSAGDTTYQYEHQESVEGLASGKLFHFRVYSADLYGNLAVSPDQTFTTLDSTDRQAPLLTEIVVDEVGHSHAVISWRSDEPADGQVEYGDGIEYTHASPLHDSLQTEHAVTLSGLEPAASYHFRVLSRDGSGNLSVSVDALFTTESESDTLCPAITEIVLEEMTGTGVTIRWKTNLPAFGQIEYGPDTTYGTLSAPEDSLSELHRIRIEGLTAGMLFHFRVLSWEEGGPVSFSPDSSFFTGSGADTVPPAIQGVLVETVSDSSARITWTTDEPAEGSVEYGPTGEYGRATPIDTNLVTEHAIGLEGLKPRTSYHFRVVCRDRSGNVAFDEDRVFQTGGEADSLPPVIDGMNVADLGGGAVRISWSTDEPAESRVDYGIDSTLGLSTERIDDLAVLHQVDVNGLAHGTLFYLQAVGWDPAGNEGRSGIVTHLIGGETPDSTGPAFTGDLMITPGIEEAVVLWVTESPCFGLVEYGPDTTYGGVVEGEGMVMVHQVTLTGLAPESEYQLRLVCTDAVGNRSVLSGESFTTLEDTLSPPPAVTQVDLLTIGEHDAVIRWKTDLPSIGQIQFGKEGETTHATPLSTAYGTSHLDTLTDLASSTVYHFQVHGLSTNGVSFSSVVDSFQTAVDRSPPPTPFLVDAGEVEEGIEVSWRNDDEEIPYSIALNRRFLPGGDWSTVWIATGGETLFVDNLAPLDLTGFEKAQYYLEVFDDQGNGAGGDTVEVLLRMHAPPLANRFRLQANRPNPFNPVTTIPFELSNGPESGWLVRIGVYNIAGERIRLLMDEFLPAGTRGEVVWDGKDYRGNSVASGTYYCRFETDRYVETRRMTLIR